MVDWNRSDGQPPFHIRRKIFHLFLGTVFILSMMTCWRLKWFFISVLAFGLVLSVLQERYHLPVMTWLLDRYDKDTDTVPGEGPLTFFAGSVITWFLFPSWIAIPAVIVLTFGDPVAYISGNMIRSPSLPWNSKKTVSGSIGFIMTASVVVSILYGPLMGVTIALVGSMIESIDWKIKFLGDDNVVIPILSATISWSIFRILGIL